MDQKSWLWNKRSTEKTLEADKVTKNEEQLTEVQKLVIQKLDIERDLRISNEKLSSALSDCNAKDNIAMKQVKIAEEAIAGWEKAETEAISLKQQHDMVLLQKAASEERLGHLDAALKECMQQLRFVREEQEKRVTKSSLEFEKMRIGLDEKLAEAGKRVADLEAENTRLTKELSGKDKVIEDLGKYRDGELKALVLRVESTEKENASLKYVVRVLEKELHIRNEEREFNRRIADVAHQENVKLEISSYYDLNNERQLTTFPQRNMGNSEMDLMDDFAEMEKLAVVSVDGSSHPSSELTRKSIDKPPSNLDADNKFRSNVSISIHKVVELLQGINIQSQDQDSEDQNGYIVRVFQWKGSELSGIVQEFVTSCNELLNGTADLQQFVQQVASNLEWVMNHCFSVQDVSSMKNAIRNDLDWDESTSEGESDDHNSCGPRKQEIKTWNVEWADKESFDVDLVKDDCFMIQESKHMIDEMLATEQSQEIQIEKLRMIKQELETQIINANHKFEKACDKISHLEKELQIKNNTCKGLEETCQDLKIQLQRITSKDGSDSGNRSQKQLQSDWEITAASEKLAECQETILNLGKQLKALASPSDAALFDKVISTTADSVVHSLSTPTKNISRRSSLLNKMLAEDSDPHAASQNTKKDYQNGENCSFSTNASMENSGKSTNSDWFDQQEKSITAVGKKNGGRSFFQKLFWRRKKRNSR